MDNVLVERLSDEVDLANRAEIAYRSFILPFIKDKKDQLFDAFESASISDTESLKEIKLMSLALSALEAEILSVIDTGKLASEALNSDKGVH